MQSVEAFVRALPKIELHAHINGSIRDSTLRELAPHPDALPTTPARSLADCFTRFAEIHIITTELRHVQRITREAIEDFAAENVIYAELRTTPKTRLERGVTKALYMDAVLQGLDDFYLQSLEASIVVKLLLTIDRRESTEEAMETVQLASKLKSRGVVGIDLAGDPLLGRFENWVAPLTLARSSGLKLSFHAGEIVDPEETQKLVEFCPERLGHMCFMEENVRARLYEKAIPVEICISSNLVTQSVPELQSHHVIDLYKRRHPVVICTDDPGIFSTSPTQEYLLAATAIGLDERGIYELAFAAIDHSFCDTQTKARLKELFERFKTSAFDS